MEFTSIIIARISDLSFEGFNRHTQTLNTLLRFGLAGLLITVAKALYSRKQLIRTHWDRIFHTCLITKTFLYEINV